MNAENLLEEINLGLPEERFQVLQAKLQSEVSWLILHDFQKLVQILYRMDVSESKLRHLLGQGTQEDAARIISTLMIERQVEKLKSRQQFKSDPSASDEERW